MISVAGMKENPVDIFEIFVESKLKNIHTCLPAKIESYDENKRKAKIKIQIKLRVKKGEPLDIPPIDNVPVQFLSTQKFKFIYPLEKGDSGIVLFSEEGIGNWLRSRDVVTGDSFARFSLTDAIFIPGVWSFNNIPTGEQSTIIINKNGNISIDGKEINFNNGNKGVARLDDATLSDSTTDSTYWTWLSGFISVFQTWVPVPQDGGAALKSALSAYLGSNPTPSKLDGKINEASDTVKAGD